MLATDITRRQKLAGIGSILLALFLAGGLVLVIQAHVSPRVFAASLQRTVGVTCAQSPTVQHCNNQDPELQGCATDAQTSDQASIVEQGFTIGKVERRWSARCQSWWGRVFDERAGSQLDMFITIGGTTISAAPTFVNTHYRILYSWMVFDESPTQQVPAVIGHLSIDAILPAASATLPAIIPGN